MKHCLTIISAENRRARHFDGALESKWTEAECARGLIDLIGAFLESNQRQGF